MKALQEEKLPQKINNYMKLHKTVNTNRLHTSLA